MRVAVHNAKNLRAHVVVQAGSPVMLLGALLSMLHSAPIGSDVLEVQLLQLWYLLHLQNPKQMLKRAAC